MKLTKSHPLFQTFISLSCRLSPENLHCDGEISRKQAHLRYLKIMKEWKIAEKQFGCTVTEDDVWAAELSK